MIVYVCRNKHCSRYQMRTERGRCRGWTLTVPEYPNTNHRCIELPLKTYA